VRPERLDELRELYRAVNDRDVETIAEFGRRNPSFEWTAAPDEVDRDTRTAELQGLRYWRDIFEAFDELRTVIEQEVVLDDEHVIFLVHHHARGAASGAEVDRREVHLWEARGGCVVSLREFATIEEAREAAEQG
jgi:ketosteroid isomerase-like protein